MKILKILMLAVVLMPFVAGATTVYRDTAEDGSVVFSDRPSSDAAERIDLPTPKPRALPPVPAFSNASGDATTETDAVVDYKVFEVLGPTPGENIRNNQGQADVRLRLEPSLNSGHYIQVQVDGQKLPNKLQSTGLRLSDLPRGQHTVQAMVYGSSGKELKRTKLVRFMMRQQSVINRGNVGLGGGGAPAKTSQ